MSTHSPRPTFRRVTATIASLSIALGTLSQSSPLLAQERSQDNKQVGNDKQPGAKSTAAVDEHAADECAELGVILGSCPGQGVCVLDTVWGSPADEAGIVHGDYILSLNGTDVSTPKQLKDALKKTKAADTAKVTVWRQGQTVERDITLASKGENPPPSHGAWLGVMLSPADGKGLMIERVMQSSPAADAGLRSGDVIVQRDDQAINDARSLAESIEDMGPGTELQLTIERDGQQQQMKVTLGDREEAPMQFTRQSMQFSDDSGMDSEAGFGGGQANSLQMMEETIDEMRKRIRDLENQVRKMNSKDTDDVSQNSSTIGENGVALVVQRDGNRNRDWNGRWNRGRNWNNNSYDWRNRYRNGYRQPLYRSPSYNNYYYRYGGSPYYGNFGRGYGYGYGQGGVRIGNLGIWW